MSTKQFCTAQNLDFKNDLVLHRPYPALSPAITPQGPCRDQTCFPGELVRLNKGLIIGGEGRRCQAFDAGPLSDHWPETSCGCLVWEAELQAFAAGKACVPW